MKKSGCSLVLVAALTTVWMPGASLTARATIITNLFTARENVNLMNSYAVDVTPLQQSLVVGLDADHLRSAYLEGIFWDGGASPTGGTNSLTINFNATRNLKKINLNHFPGSEGTAYTVESSPNGTTWTTQSATYTPSGTQGQLVLNSAVDAQYLRLTANAINDANGADRWILNTLRVFGDTGSFEDTSRSIDRVSSTGGPGGGSVTLSLDVGSVSITDTTTGEYVNDALYPLKRQVLYNMGTGDGFTLHFDSVYPTRFEQVGLYFPAFGGASFDPSATFTIKTSTDNVNYVNALTQVGGLVHGMNYFSLTSTNSGEYLRFTYTSTTSGDNRIGDVQVFGFQAIPEPSTAMLFVTGAGLVWRWSRRRRS